jgi:N-acetylneuraminic acid mutarotase
MKRNVVILAITLILTGLLGFNSMSLAQRGTWEEKAPMPTARWELCAVTVNKMIYVIGGTAGGAPILPLGAVEVYNPETNKWSKKADIPTKRRRSSGTVVDGKIYLFGGFTIVERRGKKIEKTVTAIEVYDPAADVWQKIGDSPQARHKMAVAELGGKVYLSGGANNVGGGGTTVEVYDVATTQWKKLADLNETRTGSTASAVNGKIYAIGGFRKEQVYLKTVEAYDPATDTWQNKKEMPTGREGLSYNSPAVGGKIYVLGGLDENTTVLNTNEEFDPAKDEWKKMAGMPTPRQALSVAAVGGKLYAIGGADQWNAAENLGQALATVEEYTPEGWPFAVSPQGKLATTWGRLKATQ